MTRYSSLRPKSKRTSCGFILGLLFVAYLLITGIGHAWGRPLDKIGKQDGGKVTRISGTGSERYVEYDFDINRNGRREILHGSGTAWAYEVNTVSVGSHVPVVYDEKYPSRNALGVTGELYGEWHLSSFVKQAKYALWWAFLGLIWAAIKGMSSRKK